MNNYRDNIFDAPKQVKVKLFEKDKFFKPINGTLIGREEFKKGSNWEASRYIVQYQGELENRFSNKCAQFKDNKVYVYENEFSLIKP